VGGIGTTSRTRKAPKVRNCRWGTAFSKNSRGGVGKGRGGGNTDSLGGIASGFLDGHKSETRTGECAGQRKMEKKKKATVATRSRHINLTGGVSGRGSSRGSGPEKSRSEDEIPIDVNLKLVLFGESRKNK